MADGVTVVAGLVFSSDETKKPALLGGECSACRTVIFPKMPVCPRCKSNGTVRDVLIGRAGRLFSHTIARFAPSGFKAPLFQAFIDLAEGPRIFSLIGSECPVEEGALVDGMKMSLVAEPLADTPENKNILAYKYVPEYMGSAKGNA